MQFLFCVTAFLLANDDNWRAAEQGISGNNGRVIGKQPVSADLLKAAKDSRDVIERVRPLRMPRELDAFPSRSLVQLFRLDGWILKLSDAFTRKFF